MSAPARQLRLARRSPLVAFAWLLLLAAPARAELTRFAVIVGDDRGHPGDGPLAYAEADASRVAAALEEVGGVRPENLVLLRGQDAEAARRALIAINDRVRASGPQAMLVVYYSGHADASALHLGDSSLELPELEQLVRGSAARFRLLVLDACRSGALTRVKGGSPIPPFELRLPEQPPGEGAVFLTSSSASEDSQESDEIKGSFFTHALVSGLLGAADQDGDGKVTLDEAYRYAYEATLRATSRTFAGAQHPTFEYEVRGMGDVVLSTPGLLQGARATLDLPAGRSWLLLQSSAEGPVVAELGAHDAARRLSLRPGRYFLRGRGADVLLEGAVDAPAGALVAVDESRLTRTAYARLLRKGGGEASYVTSFEAQLTARSALIDDGGLCPGAAAGGSLALRPLTLSARLGWCRGGFDNPGIRATLDEYDLEASAVHVWDAGPLAFQLGLSAGGAWLHQRFSTQGFAPPRWSTALLLAPTAGASLDLGERTYATLSLDAATYLMKSQGGPTQETSFGPSFALRASAGAGVRF